MSHFTPSESKHHVGTESPHHVLDFSNPYANSIFEGLEYLISPGTLHPTITFSPADLDGATSAVLPYSASSLHPDRARWPSGTIVTATVPQSVNASAGTGILGGLHRFYGWLSFFPGGFMKPDSGRIFSAETDFVGSDPEITFDPEEFADSFPGPLGDGNLHVNAFYAQRYLLLSGDFGPLAGQLDGFHFRESGFSTPNEYFSGDWRINAGETFFSTTYDWVVAGHAVFAMSGSPTNPIGTYTYLPNAEGEGDLGLTTINVIAGGFDP